MSKLGDRFREKHVINAWDMLKRFAPKGMDVACSYHRGNGRCEYNKSQVYSPSHQTDKDAHWLNYGKKTFPGVRGVSLAEAMMWASKQYGIDEWVSLPMDPQTKIPKRVLDSAVKWLNEQEQHEQMVRG